MSGILTRIKLHKKRLLFLGLAGIAGAACVCVGLLRWAPLAVIGAVFLAFLALNEAVVRKLRGQCAVFGARSLVRNVDYLLIGETCRPSEIVPAGKSYVQLTAPGRSMTASFELLRRAWSILRDGGCAILLADPRRETGKDFSALDVPLLHPVTVDMLGIQRLKREGQLPAFFAPWRSLRFLMSAPRGNWERAGQISQKMLDFCEERGIELRLMTKSI